MDGCRGGWFAVAIASTVDWQVARRDNLDDLEAASPPAKLKLIDIPIGLPERSARRCDREARQLLGRPRASSVFPVPCRDAVYAPDYPSACALNAKALGVKLPRQSWGIVPKIREMDQHLRNSGAAAWRESHPELAFRAFSRDHPLQHGKKTQAGKTERLALLSGYFGATKPLFESARAQFLRRQVADDDIIDALALAVSAWLSQGQLARVPAEPDTDALGFPMEIVFLPPHRQRRSSTGPDYGERSASH